MKTLFTYFNERRASSFDSERKLTFCIAVCIAGGTTWILPATYPEFVGRPGEAPWQVHLEELQIYGKARVAMTDENAPNGSMALNTNAIQVCYNGERRSLFFNILSAFTKARKMKNFSMLF